MLNLESDELVLAATIWGEARSEKLLGMEAVACVVMNRVMDARAKPRKQFGNGSVRSACLARRQFSAWDEKDPNRLLMLVLNFDEADSIMTTCHATAVQAMAGTLDDPTKGARFYKVTSLPWPKDWGPQREPLAVIGHHSFYDLDAPLPPIEEKAYV